MNAEQFVKEYKGKFLEYCPCIITSKGDVVECKEGHLNALLVLFKESFPNEEIPNGVAPMFYCIVKLNAVVVDYENQVYSDKLTPEQKEALAFLADSGMLQMYLADIHGKYELPGN